MFKLILSIVIFPEFGLYNPKINLNKVLLPIPDSPFIPVILFSLIFNVKLLIDLFFFVDFEIRV